METEDNRNPNKALTEAFVSLKTEEFEKILNETDADHLDGMFYNSGLTYAIEQNCYITTLKRRLDVVNNYKHSEVSVVKNIINDLTLYITHATKCLDLYLSKVKHYDEKVQNGYAE